MNIFKYCGCLILLFSIFSVTANTEIHQHKTKAIGKGTPIPKIELLIFRDPMDGVNIHVNIENYALGAPDMVEAKQDLTAQGILQGHAHVFVNAQKRRRLYGNDIHIPKEWLKAGVNQVAISLNSHQHENWVSGDHNIVSSVFFDLSKEPIILHKFTSQPLERNHQHH
ncbi:hypothetical protein [Paraglaciecola sp. 2405UD69-4]|uniref:hypothetical protein n=1 Tax=Paraglaciecola sp. 2405UD69-4 TaxID=3391836 RepID=UPI0039C9D87D